MKKLGSFVETPQMGGGMSVPRLVHTVPVSDLITEMGDRRQQQTCQDSRLLGTFFLPTESAKSQPLSNFDSFSKLGLLRLENLRTMARCLQTQ